MIKFVCASCGERLSVPDGHGGRKGVCPVCQAINRIPLKGYAQTQPNVPVVAKLAQIPAAPPSPPADPSSEWLPGPTLCPADTATETVIDKASAPQPPEAQIAKEPPSAPTPTEPSGKTPADSHATSAPRIERVIQNASGNPTSPALQVPGVSARLATKPGLNAPSFAPARIHQERTLPKPVKIALLVISVLAIVGAIWLALYLALRWAVPVN